MDRSLLTPDLAAGEPLQHSGIAEGDAVSPAIAASRMETVYQPIADDLARVDQRLRRELQSNYEALAPVLRHGTQLGGKRLRPALLLLSGRVVDPMRRPKPLSNDHIVMAVVIEMVHTATLVHDDVLDAAVTRRHVPTINARYGNDVSLLLGDYLFAQSFSLAATLPSTRACRWVGQAARAVCEGELRQVLGRHWWDIDEETYLDILRGKTAELTRVACQLGADLSGGDQTAVDDLGDFGNDLGIAFQIADDALDLWGDDEQVGKTLGTDLQQGKMTLPLIHLLHHRNREIASATRRALQQPPAQRLAAVMPLLRHSDAAEYTREVAEGFCQTALATLDRFPDSPALASLRQIANFSIRRGF